VRPLNIKHNISEGVRKEDVRYIVCGTKTVVAQLSRF
jgi:hypothetical protein